MKYSPSADLENMEESHTTPPFSSSCSFSSIAASSTKIHAIWCNSNHSKFFATTYDTAFTGSFNQISTLAPTYTHEKTGSLSSSSGSTAQSDDSPSSQLLCSQTHPDALIGKQHRTHPATAGTAQRSRCAGTPQAQTKMIENNTQTTVTLSDRPAAAALDMSGLRARRRNSNLKSAMHMITKGTQLMFLNCASHLAALLSTTSASLFLPLISSSKIQET
ncbi:uncharacterized protein MONOS_7545 [Monocercomonoides exilis]|uniref:uncharacterized protein n=1 Tax=Monocercomonoides exilis TaxID=2049356 RepID=UPI003559E85D|nr:hypothetical protein MONOS_7545 [Monocercomonoides exilis]|eukprot:MONOS_7545.1-p1 / transcript=MONOS_7545.1 / gene=MONOS_7545 / organism=Monocercomonoides_exilis_PA203 / gene_product=unspecified product / transcript_product=unspecified product / location=Mono_scaffold00260:23111-23767(-) / protein_length=219 / sequence_SO=supercontig / SO=protein_coding / is_pseudo=false